MSVDLRAHSATAMSPFTVDITVTRGIQNPRTEVGFVEQDLVARSPDGARAVHSSRDRLDVLDTVDIAQGDVIMCADSSIVKESTQWCVDELARSGGGVSSWWIRKLSPIGERAYNATITVRPESSRDDNGDPVLDTACEVECWVDRGVSVVDLNGLEHTDVTRISSQEREFLSTDRIWLPEDTVDVTPPLGRRVSAVGQHWEGGRVVYWCAL